MAYIDEYEQNLGEIKNLQEERITQNLEKQRTDAKATLDTEKETIAPAYKKARVGVSNSEKLEAKNVAEYLAGRGQSSGGLGSELKMRRDARTSGSTQALRTGETDALKDIAKRTSQVDLDIDSSITEKYMDVESTFLADILAKRDTERVYQEQLAEQQRAEAFKQQQYTDALAEQKRAEQFAREQFNYKKTEDSKNRYAKYYQPKDNDDGGFGGDPLGTTGGVDANGNPITPTVTVPTSARSQFDMNDFDQKNILNVAGPISMNEIWKRVDSGELAMRAPNTSGNNTDKIYLYDPNNQTASTNASFQAVNPELNAKLAAEYEAGLR